MKYAIKEININPLTPVRQAGHIQQVNPISKVHDDLHARFIAFEDEKMIVVHISCDLLGLDYRYSQEMNDYAKDIYDKPSKVILSGTHTHYAGDCTKESYHEQLIQQFKETLSSLTWQEGNLSYRYQYVPFEEVGTSRITGHKALVLLNLVQIYDDDKEIIDIIAHNCHPTILSALDTDYFSSEYVGYCLTQLTNNDHIFYTFLQGAAGDVSTRFTRSGQHYENVVELGNKLVDKITQLKGNHLENIPFTALNYEEKLIPISYDFSEIDLSHMPDNLSDREKETIGYGKIMRQRLMDNPEKLQKQMLIGKLSFGNLSILFSPNELFSYYLKQINSDKAILACYSNGYSPYIPPMDEIIYTYETFFDVLSTQTKQELVNTLKEYSK